MTDERVKIISDTTLSDGWTRLSRYDLDYTDQNGATHRVRREIYHRGEASAILLYDRKRDCVVFVKQFRLPAYLADAPAWMLEVPAGIVDEGTPEDTIIREAMEETGYRVRDANFLFRAFMSPGSFMERVNFYYALVDADDRVETGGGLEDEHEDIEVLEVPLADAFSMIENGEIFDAKTIMLLQWAALNREKLSGTKE